MWNVAGFGKQLHSGHDERLVKSVSFHFWQQHTSK
jgi:hypothetical protein